MKTKKIDNMQHVHLMSEVFPYVLIFMICIYTATWGISFFFQT